MFKYIVGNKIGLKCNTVLTRVGRSLSISKRYTWGVSHPSFKSIFVASRQDLERSDMSKSTRATVSSTTCCSFVGKMVTHSFIVVPRDTPGVSFADGQEPTTSG